MYQIVMAQTKDLSVAYASCEVDTWSWKPNSVFQPTKQ